MSKTICLFVLCCLLGSADLSALEIYLVRHGQTEWNSEGRMQGSSDIPLNETGRSQARKLGKELRDVPFCGAYASDLSRAVETAELALEGHGLKIWQDPRLQEISWGVYEGQVKTPELAAKLEKMILSDQPNGEGVETLERFTARIYPALQEIACRHLFDTRVAVVVHGGVIRTLIEKLDPGREGPPVRMKNCQYAVLNVDDHGVMTVDRIGR